jgi:hypothetical protein
MMPQKLVSAVYEKAFGREPAEEEMKIALGMLGEHPGDEAVEDFLWAVMLLPEFQLIY